MNLESYDLGESKANILLNREGAARFSHMDICIYSIIYIHIYIYIIYIYRKNRKGTRKVMMYVALSLRTYIFQGFHVGK